MDSNYKDGKIVKVKILRIVNSSMKQNTRQELENLLLPAAAETEIEPLTVTFQLDNGDKCTVDMDEAMTVKDCLNIARE